MKFKKKSTSIKEKNNNRYHEEKRMGNENFIYFKKKIHFFKKV